jgi:hypothetical protein
MSLSFWKSDDFLMGFVVAPYGTAMIAIALLAAICADL